MMCKIKNHYKFQVICDAALNVGGKNVWGKGIVCGAWVGLNEGDFVPEN